jgi:hypothetical protein
MGGADSVKVPSDPIPVEACGFDSESYVNPEPSQQALVREILHDFGMVVVIPRKPPKEAANYQVTMTTISQLTSSRTHRI